MDNHNEIWKMIVGLAFFLLAIRSMEDSMEQISGRKFKIFLKRQTDHKIKAAATSTLLAAILQSSSLVNLLVQNMAGAGILPLENALALNLGANLGTTVNSWLVLLLGFNADIEHWILPLTGITGILMSLLTKFGRVQVFFRFFFSLSLLLFSMGFIKEGMGRTVTQLSLQQIEQLPAFLFFGLIVTAIVQASSIIMVLALAALNTGNISLDAACAVVLGGEIGTTLKLFLAAANSGVTKKRIALGNFLFNVTAACITLVFLKYIAGFILHITGRQALTALVVFQTLFNVFSLFLFLPWLGTFAQFLTTRFFSAKPKTQFINTIDAAKTEQAMGAMEKESVSFINYIVDYIIGSFEKTVEMDSEGKKLMERTSGERYVAIKERYGAMHRYILQIRKQASAEQRARLDQLTSTVRNAMYAAKSMRDISADMRQLQNSSNDTKYRFYLNTAEQVPSFYRSILLLVNGRRDDPGNIKKLAKIFKDILQNYQSSLQTLYSESTTRDISEVEIATLLNSNREIYSSYKSFFYGVLDLLLRPEDTVQFQKEPGFIR